MTTVMLRHALFPLALIAAAPAMAQNSDLAAVQAHLRAVSSMTAGFTQIDRAGKRLTGTLTLKKPGKIRFQYQDGVPILVAADGKALNFIDYSARQLSRWPIGNSPLGVLLNPDQDLSRFARVTPTGDPAVLQLDARDPKHPEYGRISLFFTREAGAPGGLKMQGWVMIDAQSNQTQIRLDQPRYNVAVSDTMFRFNDPRRPARR